MNSGKFRRMTLGSIAVCILLLSTLAVCHKGIDVAYDPSCPACQLANTPGFHTGDGSFSTLIPAQVPISFVPVWQETSVRSASRLLSFIPRSPPSGIVS